MIANCDKLEANKNKHKHSILLSAFLLRLFFLSFCTKKLTCWVMCSVTLALNMQNWKGRPPSPQKKQQHALVYHWPWGVLFICKARSFTCYASFPFLDCSTYHVMEHRLSDNCSNTNPSLSYHGKTLRLFPVISKNLTNDAQKPNLKIRNDRLKQSLLLFISYQSGQKSLYFSVNYVLSFKIENYILIFQKKTLISLLINPL